MPKRPVQKGISFPQRASEDIDMDQFYPSEDHCILDIMANTDTPYSIARMAAKLVYGEGWHFDNGYLPRSIILSPDFDNPDSININMVPGVIREKGYSDSE